METKKKFEFKWVYGLFTLKVLIITLLSYRIHTLNKIVEEEKMEILAKEYTILNNARISELSKSMVQVKLLECKGVKRDKLDSIMVVLYNANDRIMKRDSAFIVERKRQLDNLYK